MRWRFAVSVPIQATSSVLAPMEDIRSVRDLRGPCNVSKMRTHEHSQSRVDMIGYVFPVSVIGVLEMALYSPERRDQSGECGS